MCSLLKGAVVLVCLLLSACSVEDLAETLIPDGVQKQLNRINNSIISRDFDALRAAAITSLSDKEFATKLDEVFVYLPRGKFIGRELVGYNSVSLKTVSGTAQTTYIAGYQYEYTDGWAYVELRLMAENEQIALQTLNITRLTQSLRELNAFTFSGKRAVHYVFFVFAILNPIFIVATFVACFRIRNLKRRKRWLAFILFGVGSATLNWTTGATNFNLLNIALLGSGFMMASAFAPVMLNVGFPLGAVLFWSFRQSDKLTLVPEQSMEDNRSG